MSIQGKVEELNSIKNELKSLRERGTILRKRSKIIEEEIDDYLDMKNQKGVKYKGTAIYIETGTKRQSKKQTDAKSDAILVLQKSGVKSPERIFTEMMDARKGKIIEDRKLRFKKINEEK